MRYFILVLSVISLILLLISCSPSAPAKVECVDFSENPHLSGEVEVSPGDEFTMILCSNPTTGYQWSEIADISHPKIVEQVKHIYNPPSAEVDPTTGSAGEEVWTFKAITTGNSAISVEYSRPWDGGEKGTWTYKLNVTVK